MPLPQIDRRTQLIRLIHVAKRDRALDEGAYRDLLARETGKSSSASMTEAELDKTLKALRAIGFRVKQSAGVKQERLGPKPSRKPDRLRSGQAKLITALWIDLWQLGAVEDNSDAAIDAFVQRQTGVAHMQWLSPGKANSIIEALKDWCAREGFRMPFVAEGEDAGLAAKRALCAAIHRKLRILGASVDDFEDDFLHLDTMAGCDAEIFANVMGFRLRDVAREQRA